MQVPQAAFASFMEPRYLSWQKSEGWRYFTRPFAYSMRPSRGNCVTDSVPAHRAFSNDRNVVVRRRAAFGALRAKAAVHSATAAGPGWLGK